MRTLLLTLVTALSLSACMDTYRFVLDALPSDGESIDVSTGDAGVDALVCASPQMACGAVCVDTTSDPANCGSCAHACTGGQVCSMGACSMSCTSPLMNCAGACTDITSDRANCGACGHACAAGMACHGSVCGMSPANDTCAHATMIPLRYGAMGFTAETTMFATHDIDAPSSCTRRPGGSDVFYTFTLTKPELVYADTTGGHFDTILFFASDCHTPLPLSPLATGLVECNDDLAAAGCTGTSTQSQIAAYLQPGTYYLVLSAPPGVQGTTGILFEHVAVGNNGVPAGGVPPAPILLARGASALMGSTAGTGLVTSATVGLPDCSSNGSGSLPLSGMGPEQTYFWRSCPDQMAGAFTANTCSSSTMFDTVLYLINPGDGTGDCDDDNPACVVGGLMSRSVLPRPMGPAITVAGGGGLHALFIDGVTGGTFGSYGLNVTRP